MILYVSASSTCPDGWFQCNNGRCIELNWRCDGISHCSNGDDERNCCEFNRLCLISIMFVSNLCKRSLSHDYRVYQGFRNWGSRPLRGSRNDVQGSQRVYQFYTKYGIYYSFCCNCTYCTAYTIVYAVLCVILVYSLQSLMVVKNYCNCAKHHSEISCRFYVNRRSCSIK